MKYKLKDFVTNEMLVECGFHKTPLQHVQKQIDVLEKGLEELK